MTPPTPEWLRARVSWCCAWCEVDFGLLAGYSRSPEAARARELTAWVLRNWRGPLGDTAAWTAITKAMGRTEHSGIWDAARRAGINRKDELEKMLAVALKSGA